MADWERPSSTLELANVWRKAIKELDCDEGRGSFIFSHTVAAEEFATPLSADAQPRLQPADLIALRGVALQPGNHCKGSGLGSLSGVADRHWR